MKPEAQELLPCPFCKAIPFYKHNDCLIKHETTCYLFDFWRIQDVGRWNTRANTIPRDVAEKMFEALKDLFAMMDERVIVRDTTNDADNGWAIKSLRFVSRLKNNHEVPKLAQQHGLGGKDKQ